MYYSRAKTTFSCGEEPGYNLICDSGAERELSFKQYSYTHSVVLSSDVLCNFYTLSAQPIHWVYQEEDLAKAVEGINPEFLPKSVNPFYTQATGQQSPYGDLLIVMLESLVVCKGKSILLCSGAMLRTDALSS